MVDIDVRVLNHLKEELTWAIDINGFRLLTTIMLFKNTKSTKELKET